jgi:DNA-binding transcriptional MerR regulator
MHDHDHYAISALASRFGLTRGALLHYDRIGLLHPSGRSPAGYRRYTEADARRLGRIVTYRQAGVALRRIPSLLEEGADASPGKLLLEHLEELNRNIRELQAQQARVLALLGAGSLPARPRFLTRDEMVAVFRAAGLDDEGMDRLHVHFEKTDPSAHQHFLESLGLDAAQVLAVRQSSQPDADCQEGQPSDTHE